MTDITINNCLYTLKVKPQDISISGQGSGNCYTKSAPGYQPFFHKSVPGGIFPQNLFSTTPVMI